MVRNSRSLIDFYSGAEIFLSNALVPCTDVSIVISTLLEHSECIAKKPATHWMTVVESSFTPVNMLRQLRSSSPAQRRPGEVWNREVTLFHW